MSTIEFRGEVTERCRTDCGRLIASLPSFSTVPPEQLDALCAGAVIRRLTSGAIAYTAGMPADSLLVVVTGGLRLELGARAGGRVVALLGPGEFAGLAEVLNGGIRPVSAIATEDTLLVSVPVAAVAAAAALPGLPARMLGSLANHHDRLVREVGVHLRRSARARVAALLVEMRRGVSVHDVDVAFAEPKRLIAARLAMTPETLSRELSALAADGVIVSHRNRFRVLDADLLTVAASDTPQAAAAARAGLSANPPV